MQHHDLQVQHKRRQPGLVTIIVSAGDKDYQWRSGLAPPLPGLRGVRLEAYAFGMSDTTIARQLNGAHERDEPLTNTAGGMPVGRIELPPDTRRRVFTEQRRTDAPGTIVTGVSGPFADALRAEGALAERERIRLELVKVADEADAELDRLYPRSKRVAWRLSPRALREFARRLEAPKSAACPGSGATVFYGRSYVCSICGARGALDMDPEGSGRRVPEHRRLGP